MVDFNFPIATAKMFFLCIFQILFLWEILLNQPGYMLEDMCVLGALNLPVRYFEPHPRVT